MKFHSGEIAVQERAGVRDIAEDVGEGIADHLPPGASEFLERRQMAVLGTVDSRGNVWASVVTGDSGFIEMVDDRTLKIAALISSSDPLSRNLETESHVALFAPDFVSSRRVRVNGRGVFKNGAIIITTDEVYANCRRYLQERIFAGSRPTSVKDQKPKVSTELSTSQQEQIIRADTFFIATDNPERGADVSHKGGNPGFVRILDARRIAFPDYNGNSMFNTLGNVSVNPHAGLLFIDFDSGRTLQLTGRASIDWNHERVRTFPGAERVIDFELAQIIDTPAGFLLVAKFRQYSRNNPRL
ncbi:MAG: pyridoxamine 5'-phosphate oxidase family protein [Candidatus Binatus sp.]|uniref:pyridoxamine 5'-phosphate oxidase family protein n=1 Tax=Candidatus Binatus sp. TaxID=2811406 RepID=UPI003BAF14EB